MRPSSCSPAPAIPRSRPNHATLAFGLALPILLVLYRWGILLLVGALLLGFALVYVGRHSPGDILGSFAVAIACIWAGRVQLERIIGPLMAILARLRRASLDVDHACRQGPIASCTLGHADLACGHAERGGQS